MMCDKRDEKRRIKERRQKCDNQIESVELKQRLIHILIHLYGFICESFSFFEQESGLA